MTGPIPSVARMALGIAVIAMLVAVGTSAADALMRLAFSNPFEAAQEIIELATTLAVTLGAPAALYVWRDRALPPSPVWLGRGGNAVLALVPAAFAAFLLYFLLVRIAPALKDEVSIALKLPTLAVSAYAWIACGLLLLLLAMAAAVMAAKCPAGTVPLPAPIFFGIAGLASWMMAFGAGDFGVPATMQLVSIMSSLGSYGAPVVMAAAIGGAVAAIRPRTRIAAIAAPFALVTLSGLALQTSIAKIAVTLFIPALLVIVLNVILGHWRGWVAVVDDAIGVGILLVSALFLSAGFTTPSEFASLFGLSVFAILALIAAILAKPGSLRGLAAGFAHGIVLLFGSVLAIMVFAPITGQMGASPLEFLNTPIAVVACLGVALVLGAIFGATLAGVVVGGFFVVLGGKEIDPTLVAAVTVLAAFAGGAFQPWLSWRLAGGSPPPDAPRFFAAFLAALPPALIAAALWLRPDAALALVRYLDF